MEASVSEPCDWAQWTRLTLRQRGGRPRGVSFPVDTEDEEAFGGCRVTWILACGQRCFLAISNRGVRVGMEWLTGRLCWVGFGDCFLRVLSVRQPRLYMVHPTTYLILNTRSCILRDHSLSNDIFEKENGRWVCWPE